MSKMRDDRVEKKANKFKNVVDADPMGVNKFSKGGDADP